MLKYNLLLKKIFFLVYIFFLVAFIFINIYFTDFGKLFYLLTFVYILIPSLFFLFRNLYLKITILSLMMIIILQPIYVYIDIKIKENKVDLFAKNIRFNFFLKDNVISGINGTQNITTDHNGFRTSKNKDIYNSEKNKIFFIGGSTTANIFLDDKSIFSNVLQTKLGSNYSSINAGKDGHTSKQNLITLTHILNNFQPKYVIMLIGTNDWTKYIQQNFNPLRHNNLTQSLFLQKQPITQSYSFIYEMIKKKKSYSNASMFKKLQGKYTYKDKVNFKPKNVDEKFRNNIKLMSQLCKKYKNTKCIFMTQPAIYNMNLNKEKIQQLWFTPPYEKWALSMSSLIHVRDLYNQYILKNCKINNIMCLDLALELNDKHALFYDDIHFNKDGNLKIGNLIYKFLKENFK